MQAIIAKSLTKRYRDLTAVNGLDLEIRQGALFSLLGVNGAGTSTSIKMFTGLTAPTSGDALVGGYSITKQPKQAKGCIGVSPQETAVAPNLSVQENPELMAGIHGFSKDKTAERVRTLSGQFGLEHVLARHELWDRIRGLKGRVTIILTTHYMEEAEALSGRIGILKEGRMPAVGMAAQLIFTGIFAAGYLVIWAVIYAVIRRDTRKINRALQKNQRL